MEHPESMKRLDLLRRQYALNPEWLEELMGLPRGWTDPTHTTPVATPTSGPAID
jgi:hypothetical protein